MHVTFRGCQTYNLSVTSTKCHVWEVSVPHNMKGNETCKGFTTSTTSHVICHIPRAP